MKRESSRNHTSDSSTIQVKSGRGVRTILIDNLGLKDRRIVDATPPSYPRATAMQPQTLLEEILELLVDFSACNSPILTDISKVVGYYQVLLLHLLVPTMHMNIRFGFAD